MEKAILAGLLTWAKVVKSLRKPNRKTLSLSTLFFQPRGFLAGLFYLVLLINLSGCSSATYSEDRVHEALQEIALKEYGIPEIKVEFAGKTMGVFLPLQELFVMDFKEALMSGKITNMEQLFQPTEEAMDKVEDMLFSMSRVMLSTDRDIDFYYLQATDIEKTGMELSFLGNVDDIKKVRFWDIPRSEYRKRMLHDFKLNQPALWHKPVRQFFRDLGEKSREEIQEKYLKHTPEEKWAEEFFFTDPTGGVVEEGQATWEVLEMRSLPIQEDEVMVYAKVYGIPQGGNAQTKTEEYLFQVSSQGDKEEIRRIIPMRHMDQISESSDVPLTKELIYKSLNLWETEFDMPDLTMGEFIALQLTRRVQRIVGLDERIVNTFTEPKLLFKYEAQETPFFTFYLTAPLKGVGQQLYSKEQGIHEDVLHLWELAAREFVTVARAYHFNDWEYLEFELVQVPGFLWSASRHDMELFRKNKKTLQDILSLTAI